MPIHQQQHSAVEIFAIEPSHPQKRILAVIAYVQAAHTLEDVRQRSVAIFLHIIGGDDADRGRGCGAFLAVFGSALDGWDLQLHQIFKAQVSRSRRFQLICFRRWPAARENEQKPPVNSPLFRRPIWIPRDQEGVSPATGSLAHVDSLPQSVNKSKPFCKHIVRACRG